MKCKILIFATTAAAFYILHFSPCIAQRPKGRFLTDSIAIGKPFQFSLSFKHRSDAEVVFPDTNYNFAPFEVLKHDYLDSQTDESGSLDSAVYTLVSFDLTTIQKLSLPVWIVTEQDCTANYSYSRSVVMQQLRQAKNTLKLKEDTDLKIIPQQFNYPYIFLILISVSLIAISIYWFFGKKIERQWQLYQLFRRKRDFSKNFSRLKLKVNQKSGLENVEKAVILWKKYLRRLENKPFETFTSKEIADNLSSEKLAITLREIDAVVYGGLSSATIIDLLAVLESVARERYLRRRTAIA
jgi:hypothetical protein